MAGVRKLQTLTEAFWRDHYEVSENDLDLVTSLILEAGKPQQLDTLASAVILRRLQREKETVARQANQRQIYQPLGQYQEGQDILFSTMDFAEGHIVGIRPGHNPKYGSFEVIQVVLEGEQAPREFAAAFDHPHPLNRPVEELLGSGTGEEVSESDLVDRFSRHVAERLRTRLSAGRFCQLERGVVPARAAARYSCGLPEPGRGGHRRGDITRCSRRRS